MMEFDIDALQVLPADLATENALGEEHAAALITACRIHFSGC
ncbi:ALQxL family class IV lanthipeptide [Streptomyces sp. NBC_00536]|nr:ALQxL family class IV lanthipeptide [Streptomyces sp. NBC_00536]WUC82393.1 ALQxL family class IV lanthipeptide [Streptomyces sp. NBC_00536]